MAGIEPSDNPLLSGAFEPIGFECDDVDLEIEGVWPEGLDGVLYRIGPNPQFAPIPPYNPLQGEGMAHAFFMAGGRVAYRNRWVRTRRFLLEHEAGRALFSTSDPRANDPLVAGVDGQGAANTHILTHADRLFALEEGHAPIALDPATLETLGPCDFDGRSPGALTAHPKIDPSSGEMLAFTNLPDRKLDGRIDLHVFDAAGVLTRTESIKAPYPALVHDFAVTDEYVAFIVCPATISLDRIQRGLPPIAWEPARGAYLGILRRDGTGGAIRWRSAPTCMVWHVMNAFQSAGRLVIDLCQQDAAAFPTPDEAPPVQADLRQFLTRWTIDLEGEGPVAARRLSDVDCEYPRIDERRAGLPYRYGFVAAEGGPGTGDLLHRAIGRFDHVVGEMSLWRAPGGQSVSEPVFAPRPGAEREGDGWVLAVVFDPHRNASHLAVLDAERLADGPIARARLGHRVPAGFHGSFRRP